MRRILHLVHTPRLSGAETLVRELTTHQVGKSISAVAAFAPAEPAFFPDMARLSSLGVELFFPGRALRKLDRVNHFKRVYREFRPDAVFGHSVLPAMYGRFSLPLRGGPKFVTVLHSANNDDYAGWPLWLSEIALTRRSDLIVAVSPEGAAAYRRRMPHAPPIKIIPNGIDIERFRVAARERAQHRAKLGLGPADRMILQIGRVCSTKQQMHALDSLLVLLQTSPSLHLWFAGLIESRSYAQAMSEKIERAGLSERIRLLGSREDIPDLLAACDLFLMPSLAEAQGIALIEALASGAPIIASDIPQFRYALEQPGVRLIGPDAPIEGVLDMLGTRYEREIDLDIEKTSASYLHLVGELCGQVTRFS